MKMYEKFKEYLENTPPEIIGKEWNEIKTLELTGIDINCLEVLFQHLKLIPPNNQNIKFEKLSPEFSGDFLFN